MIRVQQFAGYCEVLMTDPHFEEVLDEYWEQAADYLAHELRKRTEQYISRMWDVTFETVKKLDAVRHHTRIQVIILDLLQKTQEAEEKILQRSLECDKEEIDRIKVSANDLVGMDEKHKIDLLMKQAVLYTTRRNALLKERTKIYDDQICHVKACASRLLLRILQ